MKACYRRHLFLGAVLAALAAGAAEPIRENFDHTGLSSTAKTWVPTGSFTNEDTHLEWDYALGRGWPQIQEGNPVLAFQGGTAAQRGRLSLRQELTNGIGRVSFTAMLASENTNAALRLVLLADGEPFATCNNPGALNGVPESFTVVPSSPLVNVKSFCITNRGYTCSIDDLEIEPFRLFVSVEGPENGDLPLGHETDIVATTVHASPDVAFAWTIEPDFAGYANDWTDPHLTLMPAEADLGTTFTLTAHLAEAADPDTFAEASCTFTVSDSMNPRFLDFEGLPTVNYDTNAGTIVPMRGMNWRWFNMHTSDARDAKIGERSARFRHTSQDLPAILESQDPFDGVGAVTLHCATFQTNGPVDFALQVCGDGEDWSTAGTFSSRDCRDITNCVFVVPVERMDPVCVRIVTTAGSGQIANLDDIRILPYGESPPILAADIPSVVPLGATSTALFTLLHADGIVREWSGSLDPPSPSATFEVTPEGDYLLSFAPVSTNEWGFYQLAVAADLADGSTHRTQAVLRVVSPPTFELVGTSSVEMPGAVDVSVTNVVLHGDNTNRWTTEWTPSPPFANAPSLAHKSRYRIADGTTEADLGEHLLTAVLTDSDTTVAAARAFPILVLSTNTPPAPGETYVIESFTPANLSLRADNAGTRWFTPFAVGSLAAGTDATNWIWRGEAQTSSEPALLDFDLSGCTNPVAMFGVRISAAADE